MSKTRCLVSASSAALVVSGFMLSVPLVGWAQLEEIVVTTRKKTENIQDVPIAVDAISAEQIARRGITNVQDVVKLSTSVQFDQSFGPQDTRIAVRGLSNTRGRSNVAFLVDGVDVTTENFISAGSGLLANQRLLTDVERIEIVKGPQSALWGRAAFAGAISYTTKEPGDEFESKVNVEAGNFGKIQLDGSVSGPVIGLEDLLGVRWSGAVWSGDGFYTNKTTGEDLGDEEGWGTALTAMLTPGDAIRIKLRTEYSDSKVGQRQSVRIGGGSRGRTGGDGADGLTFFPYPIRPEVIQGTNATQTRLANFGPAWPAGNSLGLTGPTGIYCPATFPFPDLAQAPAEVLQEFANGGICAPAHFGTGKGLQPELDVDPVTGSDYKGTDTQLWRTTLNAAIDYDFGVFSSITGWTDYQAFDELDQDYQVAPIGNAWKAHQQGRSDLDTEQFSQELRFASNFDGPVNFTIGGLYWREERKQDDLNFIIACVESGKIGGQNLAVFPDPNVVVPGICDGTNGTIDNWQQRALDQFPCQYDSQGNPIPDPTGVGNCLQDRRTPAPWRATTEHWSAYFNLTWNVSDTFELIFENRYVDESFEILRPNFSSCTSLFFPFGLVPTGIGTQEGVVTDPADDIVCTSERRMNPNIPDNVNSQTGDWMLIEGTERSSFNTPKITVNWKPTDNATYFFSWGKGIKPGGINTLAAGGSPTTIDDERFRPEEVQAWEFGAKTDWELAGFLRVNGSLFFNDYTDKQVGTQVVNDQGVLQPRVVNAAAAEAWGLELEAAWQPEFFEGLLLSANYTYLDATYVSFIDKTRSLIRGAFAGSCDVVSFDINNLPVSPSSSAAVATFCALDLSGNKLERTPENAFVGNIQYTAEFPNSPFDWFIEGTATYQDDRFLDADNGIRFDDYWMVDTRVGLTGETFEFLVYINNLFDDDTIQTGGSGPDFAKQVTELGFTAGLGVSH
ncbi:MAG: TonB-dependent receptor [Gammaproteobacteria bacterium]